jgi:K+-sensing histidine kinase KdpD
MFAGRRASVGLNLRSKHYWSASIGPSAGPWTPVVMSVVAVLVTTVILLAVDFYLATQHLILGYLLPTLFVAIYYGSTLAVLSSFACGLASAYFLFPPKFSFYIADRVHIAELGFFLLLATIASKAMSVLMDDTRPR